MTESRIALRLVRGDISLQKADALVNAANSALAGGGGVDGAIHRRGGPSIMAETAERYPEGCPTGSAVITGAGNLDAKYVIHAVAPRYSSRSDCAALLASAYERSLQLAAEYSCRSVALPSLGTGAYRYPLVNAAEIAFDTLGRFLDRNASDADFSLREVRFVLFDDTALDAFRQAASRKGFEFEE